MKRVSYFLTVLGVAMATIFSCNTKEIKLVTNVELEFAQTNTEAGFVNELIPTTLIITPEVLLPEFNYYFSYEVLEGQGSFQNENDDPLPANENLVLLPEEDTTEFVLQLNYKAATPGTHSVKVTASDNFEKSLSTILTYTIMDVPVVWEARSPLTTAEETQEIPITLSFAQKETNNTVSYQARYTVAEGSGQLLDASGTPVSLTRLTDITFGTQEFTFIANQPGTATITFELIDSNNQSIVTEVSFDITEFIVDLEAPIITPIGANPLVVFTGSTYEDPGATATDNKDDDAEITAAIRTDSSAVDTSISGDYLVTYTVTDKGDNTAIATRTVTVQVNTSDVPQFMVKGNTADFITTLELGNPYTLGTIDNLSDNGTITAEDIVDTNTIEGSSPAVGSYTVAYLATDNDNNTSTIIETVVVQDTTAPTFTTKGNSQDFETALQAGVVYRPGTFDAIIDQSTTDDGSLTDTSGIANTAVAVGLYEVIYTLTDAEGNTSTITETIRVTDTDAPTFEVKNNDEDFEISLELGDTYPLGAIENISDNGNTDNGVIADPSNIADTMPEVGTYTVTYTVTDDQNNSTTITETISIKDTTAPDFTVKSNPDDFTTTVDFGGSYTVGTIENPSDLSTFTENTTGAAAVDTNTTGNYIVTYTVEDEYGNVKTILETVTVGVQNTNPTTVIAATPELFGVAPYTVTLDGTSSSDPDAGDGIASFLWILGNGNQNTNPTVSQTYTEAGEYEITLRVTDQNGATDERTVTIVVTANQSPIFTIKNTTAPTPLTTTLAVGELFTLGSFTALQDENITTVVTSITGAKALDGKNLCFSDTNATITYTATDEQNLSSLLVETIVVTDTQKPVINYTGPTTVDIVRGQNYTPPALVLSDNDPCVNGQVATRTGSVDNTALGTTMLTYSGKDAKGNLADEVRIEINVINRAPIAANDIITVEEGQSVTIDVLANDSDPDGDAISMVTSPVPSVGIGTFTTVESNTLVYQAPANSGPATTSFTYTLTDTNGSTDTGTVTITITEKMNTAPVARIVPSATSGEAPLTVSFNGSSSSDPDGDAITYSWSTGSSTSTTSKRYTAAGVYTVRLTVSDGLLSNSKSVTIRITEPIDPDPCNDTEAINDCIDLPGKCWDFELCRCVLGDDTQCIK